MTLLEAIRHILKDKYPDFADKVTPDHLIAMELLGVNPTYWIVCVMASKEEIGWTDDLYFRVYHSDMFAEELVVAGTELLGPIPHLN